MATSTSADASAPLGGRIRVPKTQAVPVGAGVTRRYWLFAVPATVVVAAGIVFPWLCSIYMSVNDWNVSARP